MLDCPTCGSYRSLVHYATGIQRRRFPRGQFVCQHDVQAWHLQLEILKREFDLTSSLVIKNALQREIEAIIIEYCLVDGLEVA